MLGRKNYTPDEVRTAKAGVEQQCSAYRKLREAAAGAGGDAVAEFEPLFFNNMVLVLDRPFVHRLRMTTGKDGNPLNEVELLCDSLINNGGVLRGNNVVKYVAEDAVVGLQVGDEIKLGASEFEGLASAFFAELERKFVTG